MTQTGPHKVLMACTITMVAVSAVFMTQSIFLEISRSFDIHVTQARFSFSIVSLFYAVSFLLIGPTTDRFNLPKFAVTGIGLLSITVFLTSWTTHFDIFIIAMALMGFSAALIPAAMFPHVTVISPEHKMGIYLGAIVAAGTLGVIFGRVSMGLLTSYIGWRSSFRVFSGVLFLLTVLSFFVLTDKNGEIPRNRDGVLKLYTNAIRILFEPRTLSLLLAGFSLFFGFLGMVTFLTYRLVAPPFHYSAGEVGWVSLAGLTALIAPFSGDISHKIGPYKVIIAGLITCLLSFQLMGWFQSIASITLGLLLLFLGVYSCQPLIFLLMGQEVPKRAMGSASSLYILFCIGGGSLSSIVLGPVWRSYGWEGITLICSFSLVISLSIMSVNALKSCKMSSEVA